MQTANKKYSCPYEGKCRLNAQKAVSDGIVLFGKQLSALYNCPF